MLLCIGCHYLCLSFVVFVVHVDVLPCLALCCPVERKNKTLRWVGLPESCNALKGASAEVAADDSRLLVGVGVVLAESRLLLMMGSSDDGA